MCSEKTRFWLTDPLMIWVLDWTHTMSPWSSKTNRLTPWVAPSVTNRLPAREGAEVTHSFGLILMFVRIVYRV